MPYLRGSVKKRHLRDRGAQAARHRAHGQASSIQAQPPLGRTFPMLLLKMAIEIVDYSGFIHWNGDL